MIDYTIGKKYKIKTKKGIVQKFLSYKKGSDLYFTEKQEDINPSKLGFMFNGRGTIHSTNNIIGVCNEIQKH